MHLYMYNVNMDPRESFSSELTFLECHYLILTYGLLLHPVFARTQHRIEAAGLYGLRRIFEKLGLCPFSIIAGAYTYFQDSRICKMEFFKMRL